MAEDNNTKRDDSAAMLEEEEENKCCTLSFWRKRTDEGIWKPFWMQRNTVKIITCDRSTAHFDYAILIAIQICSDVHRSWTYFRFDYIETK